MKVESNTLGDEGNGSCQFAVGNKRSGYKKNSPADVLVRVKLMLPML